MDELTIQPGPADTGAMGHISNTVLPAWFQQARQSLFHRVNPEIDPADWPRVVVRYEVDLLRQMDVVAPVTLRTAVAHIGTSSIRVAQQAWQRGQLAARGIAVLVCFDEQTQRARPISVPVRERLESLLKEADETAE